MKIAKISSLLLFAALTTSARALALPSEGFETFGFGGGSSSGQGLAKKLTMQFGYVNPAWTSDFENAQVYAALPVWGSNYFTAGYSLEAGNKLYDRDAYFFRYDYTFWGQSIDLKLTHINEHFLGTGKNIISADYNSAFHIGTNAQIYVALGAYFRYALNQWDSNQWSPVNFNTSDHEWYIEATIGGRVLFYGLSFITLDINSRDAFNSYNADFVAFDVSLNIVSSDKLTWRIINSTRMSSTFMGTADVGVESIYAGVVAEF